MSESKNLTREPTETRAGGTHMFASINLLLKTEKSPFHVDLDRIRVFLDQLLKETKLIAPRTALICELAAVGKDGFGFEIGVLVVDSEGVVDFGSKVPKPVS